MDSAVVAKLLGHTSTRMVDLVYGRLAGENLVTAVTTLPSAVHRAFDAGRVASAWGRGHGGVYVGLS